MGTNRSVGRQKRKISFVDSEVIILQHTDQCLINYYVPVGAIKYDFYTLFCLFLCLFFPFIFCYMHFP